MIRAAIAADAPALMAMGKAFWIESGHDKTGDFDDVSFAKTLAAFAMVDLLLVVEKDGEVVGMAAADVGPAFWNHNVLLAREAFFYIIPSARKGLGRKILTALETVAGACGATYFDVVAEPGPRSAALSELYRRHGYNPAETTFRKRLSTPGIV